LEPLPVLDDGHRVTEWCGATDRDVQAWYDHLVSSGVRAFVFEHEVRHAGHHHARAVFRYPAAGEVRS
jgi:hypothetical protein